MMTKHMQATWMRVSAWPMLRWRCTDYGVLRGRTRSAALDRWTTVDPRHRGSRLFSTFLYLSFSLPSIYCSARLSHSVPFCLLYLCSFLAPFLSPLSFPPPPPLLSGLIPGLRTTTGAVADIQHGKASDTTTRPRQRHCACLHHLHPFL